MNMHSVTQNTTSFTRELRLARSVTRRRFLQRTAGAATILTTASYSKILGAADKIRMGLIGCGSRGQHVLSLFRLDTSVEVVGLCDVFEEQILGAKKDSPAAEGTPEHRKLLDRKDVDAVLIATPDHWHAPVSIDALNAGKHVYCEKPLTLVPEEGPQIVKAARLNGRICQVGMQQRSGKHYLQAKREIVDAGKLGKVTLARTWWHGNTYHLRRAPESLQKKPSTLDWGRFLGPVKWREYDPQQYFNWRAYLDFGGGQVTDLFTHWIDVVHMMLGKEIPISAVAAGGVYNYKDGRTAPDTINVLLEYPDELTATFEATLVPGIKGEGVELCGTEGKLFIDRQRYEFQPAGKDAKPIEVKAESGQRDHLTFDHVQNFLECTRTGKLPRGDVLIGHRSAQASHLGNLAYVQKRRLKFDPVREEILPL